MNLSLLADSKNPHCLIYLIPLKITYIMSEERELQKCALIPVRLMV